LIVHIILEGNYEEWGGLTYTYEVRESQLDWPTGVDKVFRHEEYDWVTMVTCEYFNPISGEYFLRRMVRAVLVDVSAE